MQAIGLLLLTRSLLIFFAVQELCKHSNHCFVLANQLLTQSIRLASYLVVGSSHMAAADQEEALHNYKLVDHGEELHNQDKYQEVGHRNQEVEHCNQGNLLD